MSSDLYTHLNIPRDADAAAIHRAYRKRAKKDHPDAGGDSKSFALTTLAKDILTDPSKRERYDRTGDAEASSVDNSAAEIMQVVVALVEAIINANTQHNIDPCTVNLATEAIKLGNEKLREGGNERKALEARLKKETRLLNRFKRKSPGDNFLDKIMQGRIKPIEEGLRNCDLALERLKAAIEILKDYDFANDPPVPTAQQGRVFVQMMPWGQSSSTR